MSRGYYGRAKLISINGDKIEYAYSGENWNSPTSKEGDALLFDGRFVIHANVQTVEVDACKNEFDRQGQPYIAMKLAGKIIREHQEDGAWAKECSFLI